MITVTPIASSSTGNCYHVNDGNTRLLLECGIPWRKIQQALKHEASNFAGCLVTHCHLDHSKAIKDVMKAGIEVYTSTGTAEAVGAAGHRMHHVKSMQQFKVGTWAILPFDVEHDAPEPLGFLLQSISSGEKLLFMTDTSYCKYRFKGLSHLMIECNFDNEILDRNIRDGIVDGSRKQRLLTSHMSLQRVKDFLKNNDTSKLQAVWLLHLSDHNSDEQLFKTEIQRMTGVPVYVC